MKNKERSIIYYLYFAYQKPVAKQWSGTNKKKSGRILEGRIWNEMPAAGETEAHEGFCGKISDKPEQELGMARKYTVVIERDEEGWLVSEVVELPGCHTQARTMDELLARTKEAIRAYLGATGAC